MDCVPASPALVDPKIMTLLNNPDFIINDIFLPFFNEYKIFGATIRTCIQGMVLIISDLIVI